jgi:hypothetical protein
MPCGPHNMHTFRCPCTKRGTKLVRSLWKENCATELPNRSSWAKPRAQKWTSSVHKRRAVYSVCWRLLPREKGLYFVDGDNGIAYAVRSWPFHRASKRSTWDWSETMGFFVDKVSMGQVFILVQYGLVLRRGNVLEYLVINRIVVKRVLFKWFKLRWAKKISQIILWFTIFLYIMTYNFNLRFSPASIFLITNILVSKVTVFLVFFAPFCRRWQSVSLMDVMGVKITTNLKKLHWNEKEGTCAHRKGARNALSTKRTLELRQWYTAIWEFSVRLDKCCKSESS